MNKAIEKTVKKIKKINIHTVQSNAVFAKMSRADQRVTIARDVLKELANNVLVVSEGEYSNIENDDELEIGFIENDTRSLRDLLPKITKCNVCAKGALLICIVARRNKVTVKQFDHQAWSSSNLSSTLGNIFSPSQLKMIENEFEDSHIESGYTPVMQLGRFYDKKRLQIIMNNIIRNKGTFVPKYQDSYR